MWDYTEKVFDHFKNPRNVGVIDNPDGVGMVGSMACGDALKLMFKLDENKKIKEVKFQTFGCASAIASSSALTELIMGKTLEDAEKITNKEIADYLGGLPDQKMHCSVLGRDALLAAIKNYRSGQPELKEKTNVVCTCFGIEEEEIIRVIRENSLGSVEEVTNYTKAGGGCGGCKPDIQRILEKVLGNTYQKTNPVKAKESEISKKKLTNVQKMRLIQETMEREIRPILKKDKGDIELIDIEGNKVVVALRGTCSNCRLADFTLKEMVEQKLREFVDKDLVVMEENPGELGERI